jgi:hypothetical protein
MEKFLSKHAGPITGTLSCFDRLIFRGHLPLGYPNAMEGFLHAQGLLSRDLKTFLLRQAERIKAHAREVAERAGRPYEYYDAGIRKEARARKIVERDRISAGLICVLAVVEPCRSFRLLFGKGRPRILPAHRKCLCLYFYFMDKEFGFMHIRIPTWFPLTLQVYVNGHEWLARKLDDRGIAYLLIENAFVRLEDPVAAPELADKFSALDWPLLLNRWAAQVNPMLRDLLRNMHYYWTTNQAEYSTNVMFKHRAALRDLYPRLLRHATLNFSAEDVLTFLGRKLTGHFQGEVLTEYKKRAPGARVRHWMKQNWIKMYNKHGSIIRVETVINNPYEFKVRRRTRRAGLEVVDWLPLPRGVAYLPRYAEVSGAANARYLDALALVDDPGAAYRAFDKLARPAHAHGRPVAGFNPASSDTLQLFRTVLRGEHTVAGFRNRNLREHLLPATTNPDETRRHSARISRLLGRLHSHGLIAKIPRSRHWRVSRAGFSIMAAALRVRDDYFPDALAACAA